MNKKLFLAAAVVILAAGCRKEAEKTEIGNAPSISTTSNTKSRNPYSLDNMRKAMTNLLMRDVQLTANNKQQYARGKISFGAGSQQLTIDKSLTFDETTALVKKEMGATHYYVKFIPRNDADYSKLKVDSNLMIYPFPMDTETSKYSGNYRDPSVPAGVPTYQYASVPVGYTLPNVPYVKLEDLYVPDEGKAQNMVTLKGSGNSSYMVSARLLANQSDCGTVSTIEDENTDPLGLEDNEECEPGIGTGGGGGGGSSDPNRNGENWRPHGRLTMYDDSLKQTIGVEGIKVRARRWFTTYTGISDYEGNYAVDGWYTRPANYWLDFERYDFSVNDHRGGPREISGPKIEGRWDVDFTGFDKFCATIFRAAFHYYYKDIQGLTRPPQNSFWATQVKIAAFDWHQTSDNGSMWAGRNTLLGSLIHIYKPLRGPNEIYDTTIHELTHAVHWDMYAHTFIGTYRMTSNKVIESYATGIAYALTKMVYPNHPGRFCANNTDYKNVIMDMMDGYDPSYTTPFVGYYGLGGNLDLVEGYDILQIQQSVFGQTSWDGWRDNIKNLYNNPTEQHLDALFLNWWNW